jgi:hypothetical protein
MLAIRGNENMRLSRIKTAANPEAKAQDKSALKRKYFRTAPHDSPTTNDPPTNHPTVTQS